jgi:hypothetical protein
MENTTLEILTILLCESFLSRIGIAELDVGKAFASASLAIERDVDLYDNKSAMGLHVFVSCNVVVGLFVQSKRHLLKYSSWVHLNCNCIGCPYQVLILKRKGWEGEGC